jgi:uncharacterized protein YegJ (DUF2314 family)
MDRDVKLAKDIIKKMRDLLSPKLDYIVQFAPEVKFHESCDELWLDSIVFEADGAYMDAVTINEDGVVLSLEEGPYQELFDIEDLADILDCDSDDVLELSPEIEKYVEKANELYRKRGN